MKQGNKRFLRWLLLFVVFLVFIKIITYIWGELDLYTAAVVCVLIFSGNFLINYINSYFK